MMEILVNGFFALFFAYLAWKTLRFGRISGVFGSFSKAEKPAAFIAIVALQTGVVVINILLLIEKLK